MDVSKVSNYLYKPPINAKPTNPIQDAIVADARKVGLYDPNEKNALEEYEQLHKGMQSELYRPNGKIKRLDSPVMPNLSVYV